MTGLNYNTTTLPCGLSVIHTPSPTDVVYCGFCINTGTRDEAENESGMAHFCEHLIFKGTDRRRAWHIQNRMENVGGDLNAYTNKEETVVHAAFLKEHLDRAIDLLADIVWHSNFPQHELEKEREVVLDEIDSYEDSPSELIYDNFENLIFQGHPIGRSILGTPQALRGYTSDHALSFTARHYHPANMVFFIMGNVDFKRVVRLLQKAVDRQPLRLEPFEQQRQAPTLYKPQRMEQNRQTRQSHVLMGCPTYNAYHKKRIGLYVLNNLLGGPGMNSRLNLSLREKRGLVYNVESNACFYTDTGVFGIYYGCSPEDTHHCLELTLKELKKLREKPLTTMQLSAAQKQIKGQIGVSCDDFENLALSIGKSYLRYGCGRNLQALYEAIDSLTPHLLQEIAQETFDENNLSWLIYSGNA